MKTESQVWSAAESSLEYTEMQKGCDDKIKFQCFMVFTSLRLLEVMPDKENTYHVVKCFEWAQISSNPIIKQLKQEMSAQYLSTMVS